MTVHPDDVAAVSYALRNVPFGDWNNLVPAIIFALDAARAKRLPAEVAKTVALLRLGCDHDLDVADLLVTLATELEQAKARAEKADALAKDRRDDRRSQAGLSWEDATG